MPENTPNKGEPEAGLYVLAGPIGNLGDISQRAVEVLKKASAVAAEDTRRTVKLLSSLGLRKNIISYREQNHDRIWPKICRVLSEGGVLALLSDAGAPVIADPGARLVRAVREAGFGVWPVPGPSSVITALTVSGFWAERFVFGGFLPEKSAGRRALVRQLDTLGLVMVFFESPHRLAESIGDLVLELGGRREAFLAREMTKVYEEYLPLSLEKLHESVIENPRKGEITLVIGPKPKDKSPEIDWAEVLAGAGSDSRPTAELAEELWHLTGYSKKEIYNRLLTLRREKEADKA
ncbi:MAG: 16S rRNA (cytidine(1402)-2'-O)-methyltransferase [Deltaproteobacteria bacterium]|jgi:16S rRNA (cytidine1402-2'-O)-methyltransferase|nr:16S rRNA (cytidine(1402)-2'-O)-methyltransferase [Deltaproteobacteria bacterium]